MRSGPLSCELDMEDFLRRSLKSPVRVMLERESAPAEVQAARDYDAESQRLLEVLHDH